VWLLGTASLCGFFVYCFGDGLVKASSSAAQVLLVSGTSYLAISSACYFPGSLFQIRPPSCTVAV
jgi:hypothetical protein